jgi:prepilin-type N-terminal cleavage/methylation domain-containing protein
MIKGGDRMKTNSIKKNLNSKRGMTLVEVLVALAILMLIIFTFTPLFATYLKNIRNSGDYTRKNYEKASLMERLLANNGQNPSTYETKVNSVPLKLSIGDNSLIFYESSTDSGTYLKKQLGGKILTTDSGFAGGDNEYVSYYVGSISNQMICFPKSLTDDFLETEIKVLPMGFDFALNGGNVDYTKFKVYYTDSSREDAHGNFVTIPLGNTGADGKGSYYSISTLKEDGEVVGVTFTFYGGNDTICFQNSPIVIEYDNIYTVNVEIGAPKIIMVGEAAKQSLSSTTEDYYYYVTHGVDTATGQMDIIAKKMKSKTDSAVDLSSAMNCVEWVEPGFGTDESGNTNDYGYYVMGGDNGQIRRFWRHGSVSKPGNYYWGGDSVVNMTAYSTGTTSMTTVPNATEVNESIMYQGATSTDNENLGSNLLKLFEVDKGLYAEYIAYTANYGTANANTSKYVYVDGSTRYDNATGLFGVNHGILDKLERKQLTASYSDLTGYNSGNEITITSVGSIPLITNNVKGAYKSDSPKLAVDYDGNAKFSFSGVAYPQKSYTLYCGTIPAYMDLLTKHWSNNNKGYMATLGVGYLNNAYGVTGLFGDQNTTINTGFGKTYSGWDLLNYKENITEENGKETLKNKTNSITPGALLANFRQDKGITMGEQVAITIGYLSQPFASSLTPVPGRDSDSSKYLSNNKWNHDFNVMAPREFLTFLDMVSFKLDIVKKGSGGAVEIVPTSFSVAAGYTLALTASDIRGANRLTNLFNYGLIYLRASGDGSGSDDTIDNQLQSGKGWSMQAESNIFHPFYGIDQTAEGSYVKLGYGNSQGGALNTIMEIGTSISSSIKTVSCYGWDNSKHKSNYLVAAFDSGLFGSDGTKYDPSVQNENTHIMQATRCTSVDYGLNPYGCPEFMVGTDNGSVLSWYYDESIGNSGDNHNKVSRAMKKEFEYYSWSNNSPDTGLGGNYDYWTQIRDYHSTSSRMKSNVEADGYRFISTLKSINDIKYGDDYWVAVGQQGDKSANDAGCGANARNDSGASNTTGSYINVRYDKAQDDLAWMAVRVSNEKITFLSVEYCEGIWYAMGFVDDGGNAGENSEKANNGVQDPGEEGVLYYATNPLETSFTSDGSSGSYDTHTYNGGWRKVITRTDNDTYTNSNTTVVLCNSNGSKTDFILEGVNAMASQG